ncbi:hypothetical protein A6J42_08220 [Leptospira interrogans serovar Copenhageni]|nr:hypothetical protein A6J42_08220 [Leptospira interrogans serovar Copenhageni]ASP42741.1 hypothetical protein AMR47_18230 [Leptospira interrogans]KAA1291300.1 hypothetical protein C4X99_13810 [Leptospira interrogans serovar Geyaweera]OOB96043.1 hypothetical protein B0191_04415 [Leptospira interrogans serovar Hardjo]
MCIYELYVIYNFFKIAKFIYIVLVTWAYNTHNYIIKYLIFCMESVFCDKINGTQFYRDR